MPVDASAQTADQARALALFVKLMRASRAVMAATEPSMTATGLTTTQFAVMEALLHRGPLSHGELKAKVLTSAGNLTDVIDKLCARGLTERHREEADARRVCVALTASGRTLIEATFAPHAAQIAAVIGRLAREEQDQLAGLLRKLGLAASAAVPR